MAHGNDLGGSIRFPASACGLFGLKPTRARNPLGPEYGDVIGGWAVEHAVTRSVRDSAALLDATAGPAPGDPYSAPPPARPFADEVGADPGRLRIALHGPHRRRRARCTPTASPAARRRGRAAARSSATRWSRPTCPASTPGGRRGDRHGVRRGDRVDRRATGSGAAVASPAPDELEPLTRAYWEAGRGVSAADYLLAVDDLQRVRPRGGAASSRDASTCG